MPASRRRWQYIAAAPTVASVQSIWAQRRISGTVRAPVPTMILDGDRYRIWFGGDFTLEAIGQCDTPLVQYSACCWPWSSGSSGFGEETKAPWWHFGRDKEVSSAPPAVTPAPSLAPAQTITPAMPTSPAVTPTEKESWVSWPSMPKMTWFEPTRGNRSRHDRSVRDEHARHARSAIAPTAARTSASRHIGRVRETPGRNSQLVRRRLSRAPRPGSR